MILLEILKYTLPSVIVFLTAYFILKQVFDKQREQYQAELKTQIIKENAKILVPIRMQAYERMVLFLERIAPANLILRQNQPELNAFQFQTQLIQAIREEFEHNLSQQLYISTNAWEQVIQAKEEIVSIINTAASQLKSDEPSSLLGKLVINSEESLKKPIIKLAIDTLKKELKDNLG
ncbi:MAG: hypothetical protein PF484_02905 [Bacteroidales bacterium]|jgi:hypothetical protein|nr:hypothetical protein [Bacteroidales bacterium]